MNSIKSLLSVVLLTVAIPFAVQASGSAVTPPPGDPVRKEILDVLRQEVKRMHGIDVVFVVKHLKVKDGWAWVHALPQSADGKNRYEDISALMQMDNHQWKVAEIPCTEVDNPECLDGADYFKQLQVRYPDISAELLPNYSAPKPE